MTESAKEQQQTCAYSKVDTDSKRCKDTEHEENSFRERKNREQKPIKVQQMLKPEGPAEESSGEQCEDG